MVEFDCAHCGRLIVSFGRDAAPEPALCSTCEWLAECVPDKAVRARIAARILDENEFSDWKAAQS